MSESIKTEKSASTPPAASVSTAPTHEGRATQLKVAASQAGDFDAQEKALAPVQRHGGKEDVGSVHAAAAHGISGGGGALPHGGAIQKAFGGYDVSNVQAHTDSKATQGAGAMGADAYATGNHVAFAGAPDLHTAAHEAAHVVQQEAGVQLSGGVGTVGDPYEQHADKVADAVVAGKSAEPILSEMAGGGGGSAEVQMVATRRTKGEMQGVVGGKVTLDDYKKDAGVTDADVGQAGKDMDATNKKDLATIVAEIKAVVGTAAPVARSEKEMLAAIASGVLPRYVARVSPKDFFAGGTFGRANSNQIFATEPSDVMGLSPAKALVKVGWEPADLQRYVGQPIAMCIFDTQTPASDKVGGDNVTKTVVTEMNWDTLEGVCKDKAGNAWFFAQLSKNSKKLSDGREITVTEADLPQLFVLARTVPVGGMPKADDEWRAKYTMFRQILTDGVSANRLYSGMGATVSGKGQTGAREVMIMNGGSGFKLEPGKNADIIDIGPLDGKELQGLL